MGFDAMSASTPTTDDTTPCIEWVVVDGSGLQFAFLEPDNAVFHKATGETHLLSALPTLILQMLLDSPKSTRVLASDTAQACETENDPDWFEKISGVLRSLDGLELIEGRTMRHP